MAGLMAGAISLLGGVREAGGQVVGSWDTNANGNWSTATNWVGDLVPNGAGDTANFTWNITANRTITLDVPVTLGHMTIYDDETSSGSSGSAYIISGSNTLTFDADGNTAVLGEATLTFGNGVDINGNTNTISVPIALADTLNIIMQDLSVRQGNIISGPISTVTGGAVAGEVAIRISNPTQTNGPAYLWSELFFRGTNTFTGQVVVESGVLRLETTNRTLGAAGVGNETIVTGAGRVDLGGLDFKTSADVAEIFRLNGHGVYNVGALVNNSFSTGSSNINYLALDGDSTINSQRRIDLRRIDGGGAFATLELNGHELTKFGGSEFVLIDTNITGGGTINVYEGELRIESSSQTSTNSTNISGLTINLMYNPNPWDGLNPFNGTRTGSDVYSNTTVINDTNGNTVIESRLEFYNQNVTHSNVTINLNRGSIERSGRTGTGEFYTTTLDSGSVINLVGGGVRDNYFNIAGGGASYNSGTGQYDAPGSLLVQGEIDNTSGDNEGTGFTKRGNRELRLENANANFNGTVVVKQNPGRYLTPGFNTTNGAIESQYASLALSGASGGLVNAADIIVERYGSVWLDNTAANSNNRLNDNGFFSLRNGFLVLTTHATENNTENLGNLRTLIGTNKLFVDTRAGTGNADISFESLTINEGSALKIAFVDSTDTWGVGAADQRIAINNLDPDQMVGNTTGTTDRAVLLGVFGSIVPGAGGATVTRPLAALEAGQARSNVSARLLTTEVVDGVTYIRPLLDSEYAQNGQAQTGTNWLLNTSLGTFGNKNNALNVAQDTTINSLTIADLSNDNSNGEYVRIANGATLTISSGMINFANYGFANDVNTEASIRGGMLDFAGRQAMINSGNFWEDLNRNDASYYAYISGNSAYVRSSIVNADGLVKTGRNSIYLDTWNQFIEGSKAYATDEGSIIARHSNALDGLSEVVIAGGGNFLLQGGVNITGVNVRVTALDGDRVVLRSESHQNTWGGDVIFDALDSSGSHEFQRQRITANSNATLTLYGNIYISAEAHANLNTSDLWNDPLRFSTDGSGSGIVNLRGVVMDTPTGPLDRAVNSRGDTLTTIDRNHSLAFQLTGADDVHVNVFNQWQATGRLDIRQGYFRMVYDPAAAGNEGVGFLTDTTRSRILANDYWNRAVLGADGSGAQTYHSHLVLTRDGQVFNYPYLYSYNDNRNGTQTIAGENRSGTVHLGSINNDVNFGLQYVNQGGDRDIRFVQVRGGTLAFNGRFDDEGTSVNSGVSIMGPGSVIIRGNAIGASDIERWNFIGGDALWENHLGNNRFAASTAVTTWGGGTLTLASDSTARSHTLSGNIYLLDGHSGIEAQNNLTLTLGASTATLTRRTGATMTFAESGNGAINFSASAGVPAADGERFDSWAVYGGGLNQVTDWAARSGSAGVQAFTGYTDDTFGSGVHTNVTQNAQVNADTATATVRFDTAADVDIAPGQLLTLEQGGVLVGSDIAGDVNISGGSVTSGWSGAGSRELVLHNHGTGKTTISSTITNDGGNKVSLVHSGPGTTVLASDGNTYTGDTYVNGGVLQISSDSQLGVVDGSITRLVFVNGGGSHTSNLTGQALVFNSSVAPGVAATGTFNTNGSGNVSAVTLASGGSGYSQGVWVQSETAGTENGYAGIWAIMDSGNIHLDGGTLAVTNDVTLNGARTIFLGANGGTLDVAAGSTLTINGFITSDPSHVNSSNGYANADHIGSATQRYTDRNPDIGDLIIEGGGVVRITGTPDGAGTRSYLGTNIGGIIWVNEGILRLNMARSAVGEWLGTHRSFLDGTVVGANGTIDLNSVTDPNGTSGSDIYEWFTLEGSGYKGAGTFRTAGTAQTYDFTGQINIDEDIYINNRNNSSLYLGESTGTFYGDGDIYYTGSGGEFRIYTNAPDWTGRLILGGGTSRIYGNGKVTGMTEMIMSRNNYFGFGNGSTSENQFDNRLNDDLSIFTRGNVRFRMEATGGVHSGIEKVGTLTVQRGQVAIEFDLGSDLLNSQPRLTDDYAGFHFTEIVRETGTSVHMRNFDPGTDFADETFKDTTLGNRAVVQVDVAPTLFGGDGTDGNRGIVQGFFAGTRPLWIDDNGTTQRYNEDYTSTRLVTVATNALGENYLRPLLDSEYKTVANPDTAVTTSIAWEDQGINADQNLRIVGVTSDLGIGQNELITNRRNSILTIGTKDNDCEPYVINSLTFESESFVFNDQTSGGSRNWGNFTALYILPEEELTITSGMIVMANRGVQNRGGVANNTGFNLDIRSAINGGSVNFNNQEAHFNIAGLWAHYNTSAAPNGFETSDGDNNYLFMNSTIVNATHLVKTGGAALMLQTRNEYTGNTYINQGAIYARHDQALGLGGRVELAGSGSLVIGWGVYIDDVDVYVGEMAGNHLGLAIENGSSWGGNVIIDNVDASGVAGPYARNFRTRVYSSSTNLGSIFGDIMGGPTPLSGGALRSEARLFSTYTGGGGIFDIRGNVMDSAAGAFSGVITEDNQNQVLRMEVVANNNESNVQLWNQYDAAGRIRLLRGYLRYNGEGNFYTDTAAATVNSNPLNPMVGLQMGGRNIAESSDGEGAANLAFFLANAGSTFNLKSWEVGVETHDPLNLSGADNYGRGNTTGNSTLGGENLTGEVTFGTGEGSITFTQTTRQTSAYFRDLRLYAVEDGEVTLRVNLLDGGNLVNSSITKIGTGTVNLFGSSAGDSTVEGVNVLGGVLLMGNYGEHLSRRVGTGASLLMGGGVLFMDGVGTAFTETFGSLRVNQGGSAIAVAGSGTLEFTGASITRNAGGALHFQSIAGGTMRFTHASMASVVRLGSYATFGQNASTTPFATDWAATDASGNVTAFTGYAVDAFGAGSHTDIATSQVLAGATTTDSLRFNNNTADITGGGQSLTVADGGILITSNYAGGTIIGAGVALGTGNDAVDLVIHNFGTAATTLAADISGGQNVVFTGTGTTVLTGTNTYTGTTHINGSAVVSVADFAKFGDVANATTPTNFVMNGGTIEYTGSTASPIITSRFVLGGDNAVFDVTHADGRLIFRSNSDNQFSSMDNVIAAYGTNNPTNGGLTIVGEGTVQFGDRSAAATSTDDYLGVRNSYTGLTILGDGSRALTVAIQSQARDDNQITPFGTTDSWTDGTIVRNNVTLEFAAKRGDGNHDTQYRIREWFQIGEQAGDQITFWGSTQRQPTLDGFINLIGDLTFQTQGAQYADGGGTGNSEFLISPNEGGLYGSGDIIKKGDGNVRFYNSLHSWTGDLHVEDGYLGIQSNSRTFFESTGKIYMGDASTVQTSLVRIRVEGRHIGNSTTAIDGPDFDFLMNREIIVNDNLKQEVRIEAGYLPNSGTVTFASNINLGNGNSNVVKFYYEDTTPLDPALVGYRQHVVFDVQGQLSGSNRLVIEGNEGGSINDDNDLLFTVWLRGDNTAYTGTIYIGNDQGTSIDGDDTSILRLGHANAIGTNEIRFRNSGLLQLGGMDRTFTQNLLYEGLIGESAKIQNASSTETTATFHSLINLGDPLAYQDIGVGLSDGVADVRFGGGSAKLHVVKTGGGTTVFGASTGGGAVADAFSDYTGDTSVQEGTLAAASNNSFSPNSRFIVSNGATLAFKSPTSGTVGSDSTIGSLSGVAGATVNIEAGTMRVGGDHTRDADFSGEIVGSGSIFKVGTGVQRISGNNSFDATFFGVLEGTLVLGSATATGSEFNDEIALGGPNSSEVGPIDARIELLLDGTAGEIKPNLYLNDFGADLGEYLFEGVTFIGTRQTSGTYGLLGVYDEDFDEWSSGSIEAYHNFFVVANGASTFRIGGDVSGETRITKVGTGLLELHAESDYMAIGDTTGPGAAINGSTIVRHGSIAVFNDFALGDGQVELGDRHQALATNADFATTKNLIGAKDTATFDAASDGAGGAGNGAFIGVKAEVDGVSLTQADVGKRILVKDQLENPEQNGVYVVVSVDPTCGTMNLVRAADFDESGEILYGTSIAVTGGSTQSGSAFFVSSSDVTAVNADETSPIYWEAEVLNPDVSLLLAAENLQVDNHIDINDTNGTGTTTIGGTFTSGYGVFTGDVILQHLVNVDNLKELVVTSASNDDGGVVFEGVIDEDVNGDVLSIRKTGSGTVTFVNAANGYEGKTTVEEGTLALENNGTLGDSTWLEVHQGATFDTTFTSSGGYNFNGVVSGRGTLRTDALADLVVGADGVEASIRPGMSSDPADPSKAGDMIGTLTVDGNLVLSGDSSGTERLVLQLGASGAADFNDAANFYTHLGAGTFDTYVLGQADNYDTMTGGNHDRLVVNGELVLESGGYVVVDNSAGYSLQFGDVLNLLDWVDLSDTGFDYGAVNDRRGGLLVGDLELPELAGGLQYDTSLFASHGILTVVPEPGRALLVFVGLAGLFLRRRRQP